MVVRAGRYELLRPIASGGMAKVYLGRVLGVGGFERLVAVKVMHAHLAEESEFVAMFLDEARLAARIRHPNVVGTLDIQRDEDGYFLVMDYVEGPSLHQVARVLADKEAGPMPEGIALRIFTDTLAGLHAAHELRGASDEPLNLVHRDISPHNVLLGIDGVARLTDFGIARAESRLQATRTGEVKGKVAYMSPEQIRMEGVDRRADIYAAGVVLWEMLTGQRLVPVSDDGSLMDLILGAKHPAPRDVRPSVPEALSRACAAALAGPAAERPATAAIFAEQIEAAAANDGIVLASTRVVAAFLKDLGLAEPRPLSASATTSNADAASASDPTKAVRADTGPGNVRASSTTNTAVHAPSREALDVAAARSAIPRWIGPSVLAAVVAASVVVLMRPPRPSKSVAAAARDTAPTMTAPVAAAPPLPVVSAPSVTATAPSATAEVVVTPVPVTPSATTSADARKPAPSVVSVKRKGEGTGGTFRPRDL